MRVVIPMLIAGVLSPMSLHAQDASATVYGVRDTERVEGGTRFATAIDLRARGAWAESVGELLDEAPGLHVRRMGDGFAPQSLTLRGAPGAHLTVALDGVVLNDAASDGVDLALIAPALVERADVYRGGAPLRLGTSGLGGALELVTRRSLGARTVARVMGGHGSFGARRTMATVGRRGSLVALGYRGTDGNFPYYDGGATPRLGGIVRTRNNNASDAVDVLARVCAERDGAPGPCALSVVGWREREVAGPGSHPSEGPSLTQHRALLRASMPWRVARHRGESWAAAILRRDRFANVGPVPLYGSTPYVARATSAALELGAVGTFSLPSVSLEPVLRARREGFMGSIQSEGDLTVTRWSGLLGLEGELRWRTLRVVPGVGVEVLSDEGHGDAGTRGLWTARLGASWRPTRWFEVRANGGYFERAPTLPELYGDRGFVRGNATLRTERALNGDTGVVLHRTGAVLRGRLELVGYVRDVRDLIAWVQVNRASFRAYNVSAAVVRGIEVQGRLAWGHHVELVVSYAHTDARVADGVPVVSGRRVPGVPAHDLFVAVTGRWAQRYLGSLALRTDLSFVSEAWLEETNLATLVVPARTLLGASLTWEPSFVHGLSLGLSVSNLFDVRTVSRTLSDGVVTAPVLDFLGYPLPGRALLATVTVSTTEGP